MKRKCQINAVQPITCFQVPIIGNTELELTTDEIYKCLCCKAEITEILPNGQMVGLDFSNYDKKIEITDNSTNETVTNEQVKNVEESKQLSNESKVEDSEKVVDTEELSKEPTVEDTEEVIESVDTVEKENVQFHKESTTDTVKTQVYSKNNYNKQSKNKNKKYNKK